MIVCLRTIILQGFNNSLRKGLRKALTCKCKLLPVMSIFKQSRNMATIHATPTTTLADDTVSIKLDGFEPGSKITVRSFVPEPEMHFEAHGHFVANNVGEIKVFEDPSIGGTYTGIEPMGLIWSMIQSLGQKPGLRFMKRDVTTPMVITLSAHNGHIDMAQLQTDIPVTKTEIQRTYMGQNVESIKVHTGRIRGRVFKPKGPGPFRGVIDMFGSAGGLIEFRAALLASRGFAVYALPFFRYEDLPVGFVDLDLDYFEEATDWLQEQSYVQPGGVGVCGVSWGAELSTLMATHFPHKISACVSISGSCVRTWCQMTYKGKDLPHLGFDLEGVRIVKKDPQVINTYGVLDPLETAPEEAIIQMEKAKRLLFFVGLNDKNWPVPEFIDGAERRLQALGCNNYEIVRYDKTGHLIEPPYAPITLTSYHPALSNIIEWGGHAREHQRAQEDSWQRILDFFNKYVGTNQSSTTSALHNSKL